jgi:predicted DNA-binding transcriptional regulator YafY
MPRSEKQKLKLLYIIKILERETDEYHYISMKSLIAKLEEEGIKAERKSIYSDIRLLNDFGYDIDTKKSKTNGGYALLSRNLELPELKILVDSVQTSKFITKKKSEQLIKKLEQYTSRFMERELDRQVYVSNRVKTENESIYYNVDAINLAIQKNKQIEFTYYIWNTSKELEEKKKDYAYIVSPWALTFQEDNYYLIGYDEEANKIKHYRVDKMKQISITNEKRKGNDNFKAFDLASYSNKTFGMYGGELETISLKLPNQFIGIVIDRFGKDIQIRKVNDFEVSVRIPVYVSPPFFGWLAGLGSKVEVVSPNNVREEFCRFLDEIQMQYTRRL